MRGTVRLPAIAIAVLMVAGACQSAAPTASPAGTARSTDAFDLVLDMIGPAGEVSVDMALQAFALAIAPLPGVTAPAGPNTRPDANIALGLVLKVWDSLSSAQRAAVESALEAFPNPYVSDVQADSGQAHTAAALAAFEPATAIAEPDCGLIVGDHADPSTGISTALQPYADMVRGAATAISAHLSRPLVQNLAVCLLSEAAPWRTTSITYDANGGTVGVPHSCVVYLSLDGLASLEADGDVGLALAYNTFFCFAETVSSTETLTGFFGRIPPWVINGTATWAGARIAAEVFGSPGGVGLSNAWVRYLTDPSKPLFSRDRDAIGFMAQVDQDQPSAWDVIDGMLLQSLSDGAYFSATGRRQSFNDLWAAGYFRDASRGPDWDIVGPGIPTDTVEAGSLEIANGASLPMAAPPFAVAIADLSTSADITVFVATRLRVHDGVQDLKDVFNQAFCTKEGGTNACLCPPGSPGAGQPPLPPLNTEAKLALTGLDYGGTASITGISLEDYCGTPPTPTPSPTPRATAKPRGGPDPCAKGCAKTIGEPHLNTIDDVTYDFQAAGEFTLLRSADGSIEMQARQAPYPNTTGVSYNTGLAWRINSHRVTMYAKELEYELRLDGQALEGQGTIDLGGGAQLTILNNGVEVAYADGTLSWGLGRAGVADIGVDLMVAPSEALRANVTGLLGPVPAGAEVPALPDGSVLSAPADAAARYDQLYLQLAPAWHVTDATSLFDYEAGQSTASFDVPDFPSRDAPTNVEGLQLKLGMDQFQAASEACSAVDSDQQARLDCVFDVMATQNPAWADFYEMVQKFLVAGPTTSEGPTSTPAPTATPTTALPPGFFQVASDVNLVRGATLGPDGDLYISLANADGTYSLSALDPTNGQVKATITTTGAGEVFVLNGSVWAATDDPTGYGQCSIARLDPTTLLVQAVIAVGCDTFGVGAAAVEDGLWWVDRSTADADGKGGQLRHINPTTNEVDRSVELPFLNGSLSASRTTLFYGDSAADKGFYRLLPGATAFVPMGILPVRFFPAGEGVWGQPATSGLTLPQADLYTTSSTPDRSIPIDTGAVVGADELAVYVSRVDVLWRYPIDGSPPTQIAQSATLRTADQDLPLFYGSDRLLFGAGEMVQLWFVYNFPTQGGSAVIVQSGPLP